MSSKPEDGNDPGPGFEEDDMFAHRERFPPNERERRQRPHVVSEFVRRAIENTVGSMQSTGSISRDALTYLLQQGDRGKREIVRIIAGEVGQFLRGVDLSSEVVKVLTGMQLELSATVRFRPVGDSKVRPEVAEVDVAAARTPSNEQAPADGREEARAPAPAAPTNGTSPAAGSGAANTATSGGSGE